MKKNKLIGAGLLAAFVLATPAQAQQTGFYAGIGVGQAKASKFCDGVPGSCDNKDTSFTGFVGYQFNERFGAELGYVDLGSYTASGVFLGVPFAATADAKTFELSGVGTFPVSPGFSIFGKLGIHRWDVDVSGVLPGFAGTMSESGTDWTIGAGVQWNFSPKASARFYYQRYNDVGKEETTGKDDIDVFGVSVLFRF